MMSRYGPFLITLIALLVACSDSYAPPTDRTPPTLTALGANPQVILAGDSYTELGATAVDDTDGDLTSSIVIDTSALDLSRSGTYLVEYRVSDSAGNSAVVRRDVRVLISGRWVTAAGGQMIDIGDAAVTLLDGRVLIAGKAFTSGGSPDAFARVYDPVTDQYGAVSVAAGLSVDWGFTMTLLLDGRVLIAGGGDSNAALLFDPVTTAISATSSMNSERWNHTATVLQDGRVLLAGGRFRGPGMSADTSLGSAELFDPATETFSMTGTLNDARDGHESALLSDGRVLVVAGGQMSGQPGSRVGLTSSEIFDPATGLFAQTDALPGSERASHTVNQLSDGNVIVVGGESWSGPLVADSALYDADTEVFLSAADLSTARGGHVAVSLRSDASCSGALLIAGGIVNGGQTAFDPTAVAEMFDPVLEQFYLVEPMPAASEFVTASLLQDGRVFLQTKPTRGPGEAYIFEPIGECL